MPTYRYPILIWQHSGGGWTACLVEDPNDIAAVGVTGNDVAAQIKELLQWRMKRGQTLSRPNFNESKLVWLKAAVRPEYKTDDRVFSLKQTVTLRVPSVLGRDRSQLYLCSMPTIGVRFTYDDEADLDGLASHYVQAAMKGKSPRELSRYLPPVVVHLDDAVVHIPPGASEREVRPDLDPLPLIAEPLGSRDTRRRLSRPWQRDAQVAKLVDLLGRQRSSVLLLGENGSGRTTVLAEAARKLERDGLESDDVDAANITRVRSRFWLSSAARLIAGMKYLGQWQERIEQVIEKLSEIEGILCVDNLLELVRTGGSSPSDSVAAFLVPYLQRGEMRLVGEATTAEIDACRRLLPSFAAIFTIVEIPQFNASQAIAALDQLAAVAKQNLKVDYARDAIPQIYRLFARFMPYQSFPGRAAGFLRDLFDRTARAANAARRAKNRANIEHHVADGEKAIVSSQSVIDRFIKLTGLPELFLRDEHPLKIEDVVAAFRARVMGQETAYSTVAGVITTFKAGLNDPQRPLGVLLFCGPTGVGKTELARTIADFLFGQGEDQGAATGRTKDRLLRLDMSEFAGPGAAERLIGPPGGEPSELIKRLREQPFMVVLLDEIEKAAPEVFDLLLGVFGEGRLTDRFGRLTTFRSALIIMTSNLGADRMESFGLSTAPSSDYDSEAMSFFRPEFFNRIDAVVTFAALSEPTIRAITQAELRKLGQRDGLTDGNIRLSWTDDVIKKLCVAGYDRRYGARPLQRAIETLVVTPLAKFLVARPELRDATLHMSINSAGQIEFLMKSSAK